jgi:hypothetical protein
MAEPLSYAQSLRVIGQDLDAFGVDGFELEKWANDYIVWPKKSEFTRTLSAEEGLLSKIIRKILGHDDPEKEIPTRLYFRPADLVWADIQRELNRKASTGPSDRRDLSFVLRVLGDYLDRKNARQFTISWSRTSITIRYDQKEETFTPDNLYDLGIHMYLKRSTRARPM